MKREVCTHPKKAITLILLLTASLFLASCSLLVQKADASPERIYGDPSDGVVTSIGGINPSAQGVWIGDYDNVAERAFVKFSLSGVSGTLQSASLNLFLSGSTRDGASDSTSPLSNPGLGDCLVRHIADYSTLDPSDFNAPSIGNDPGVLVSGSATPNEGYISIDVKGAVQDDINNGRAFSAFMIKVAMDKDGDGQVDRWHIISSDSAGPDHPYIEYTSAAAPPSLVGFTEWELPGGTEPTGIYVEKVVVGGTVSTHGIWYACSNAIIGKIDPPTDTFTEWSVAVDGGGAKSAIHLVVFEDTVYFTDTVGNNLAMLISKVDKVSVAGIPTSNSAPFGLSFPHFFVDSPGSLTFAETNAHKIGRLQLGGLTFDVLLPATRSSATRTPTFNLVEPEIHVVAPTVTPGNPHLPPPIFASPPVASGPFKEWSAPSSSFPLMVVPDETSLWFTTTDDCLNRLVGDDRIYIFGLPTASALTLDLKLDSTGNVWYTASAAGGNPPDIIGKLEPATWTVTEWIVPTAGSMPASLAIDDSGIVWFTETKGNKIGKLDPTTNTFYEFPLPTPEGRPWYLSIDSDGNIWFTERHANKVGVLSPAGQMVPEFPVNIAFLIAAASVAILVIHKARKPAT